MGSYYYETGQQNLVKFPILVTFLHYYAVGGKISVVVGDEMKKVFDNMFVEFK